MCSRILTQLQCLLLHGWRRKKRSKLAWTRLRRRVPAAAPEWPHCTYMLITQACCRPRLLGGVEGVDLRKWCAAPPFITTQRATKTWKLLSGRERRWFYRFNNMKKSSEVWEEENCSSVWTLSPASAWLTGCTLCGKNSTSPTQQVASRSISDCLVLAAARDEAACCVSVQTLVLLCEAPDKHMINSLCFVEACAPSSAVVALTTGNANN